MENYTPIDELFTVKSAENNIVKKPQLILPLLIILVGVAVIFIPRPSLAFPAFIFPLIGSITLCTGIVQLINAPKYIYTPSGKSIKMKKIFYDLQDKDFLLNCILNGKIDQDYKLKEGTSTALTIRAFVEKGGNFVAVQLLQYIPYEFQIITDACFFHGEQAKQLCKALNLKK